MPRSVNTPQEQILHRKGTLFNFTHTLYQTRYDYFEIKEGVRPVIVLDQHLKILVFYDCFCHSDAELGDERKEAGNVKGLAGKGFAAAGIAVADEL